MSRDTIIDRIRANKPESLPLQDFSLKPNAKTDLLQLFCKMVEEVSGRVTTIEDFDISKSYPDSKLIGSNVDFFSDSNVDLDSAPLDILQNLDVAILKGEFGVAENGAIWLPEQNMGQRVVPFITKNLVLVVDKNEIIATMHDAYKTLRDIPGYGVFISGPSKTADIEQTLVIGAQGPLTLQIVLT